MKNTLQQTGHSKGAVAVLSLPSYLKNSRPTRTSRPSFPSTPRGQNYNESLTVCVNRPAKKKREREKRVQPLHAGLPNLPLVEKITDWKQEKGFPHNIVSIVYSTFLIATNNKEDLFLRPPYCGLLLASSLPHGGCVCGGRGRSLTKCPFPPLCIPQPLFPFFPFSCSAFAGVRLLRNRGI